SDVSQELSIHGSSIIARQLISTQLRLLVKTLMPKKVLKNIDKPDSGLESLAGDAAFDAALKRLLAAPPAPRKAATRKKLGKPKGKK
ncbi:MAG: hypothetical protein WEC00_04190, partial [Dongiaceae bacterium]